MVGGVVVDCARSDEQIGRPHAGITHLTLGTGSPYVGVHSICQTPLRVPRRVLFRRSRRRRPRFSRRRKRFASVFRRSRRLLRRSRFRCLRLRWPLRLRQLGLLRPLQRLLRPSLQLRLRLRWRLPVLRRRLRFRPRVLRWRRSVVWTRRWRCWLPWLLWLWLAVSFSSRVNPTSPFWSGSAVVRLHCRPRWSTLPPYGIDQCCFCDGHQF